MLKHITMNVGSGLGFENNKLIIDFEDPSQVIRTEGGIIFPDLSLEPLEMGTLDADSWTTTNDTHRGIGLDRSCIPLNYGMYAYQITDRTNPESTTLKTKSDVITEMNLATTNNEVSPYDVEEGDLITFRQQYRKSEKCTTDVDDGLRYKSDVCLALFTVVSVTKTPTSDPSISIVDDITLRCLYSSDTTTEGGWSKGMTLI